MTNIIRYFEENCTKIEDVRVPQKKSLKKPLWLQITDLWKKYEDEPFKILSEDVSWCFWIKSLPLLGLKCKLKITVFVVFSVILPEIYSTDASNMAIFVISDSQSTRNDVLFFIFKKLFILTVIFAILVGHIELKKLT